MRKKDMELQINNLDSQLKNKQKKIDYFLTSSNQTFLYVLFIFIGEKSKSNQGQELLPKIIQMLSNFEKQMPLLTVNADEGILVLTHDFNNIPDIFLNCKKIINEQEQKKSANVCMGVEFCIINNIGRSRQKAILPGKKLPHSSPQPGGEYFQSDDKNTFWEDFFPAVRHAVLIAYLATHSQLLLSSTVYEIQKNILTGNKKIQIQKYGTLRISKEKTESDIYEICESQKKLFFPSLPIFRKKMAYRLLVALLMSAAIVFIPLIRLNIFQPVQIVLQGDLPAYCYLDYKFDTPLATIWDPEGQGYLISQPLLPGQHILSFDESHDVRNIQRLLVHDGENIIKINWQKYSLPYTYIWMSYPRFKSGEEKEQTQTQYIVFDRTTFEPINKNVIINLSLRATWSSQNIVQLLFKWEIRENNIIIAEGGRLIERDVEAGGVTRENEIITQNKYVVYRYQIYIDRDNIRLYIITSYIDSKL